MRILLLTPDYPPARGGIQLLMARLARQLPGVEVEIGTLGRASASAPDDHRVRFRLGSRPSCWHRLNVAGLNLWGLLQVIRSRPDALISGHVVVAPAGLAAQRLGVPMIQYVHADEFRTRKRLAAAAVRRASRVIAVSKYAADLALEAGALPERVSICLPGVDTPPTSPTECASRPTLLTVARMVAAYKGHDKVLDAMPRILEHVPDAEWVIVGDGPKRATLEGEVESRGLGDAVSFLGEVDDRERDEWFDRAHLFVMPSRTPEGGGGEGFGLVYLEAAAHGLPAIAGNVGGAVDAVVDGETGMLVDPLDADDIAEAVIGLLDDSTRRGRLGEAALARAREMSWDRHASAVAGVLEGLRTVA